MGVTGDQEPGAVDDREPGAVHEQKPTAKQQPIGLVRLKQTFVEPVRKNAKEVAAGGVLAGIAALLGGDDDAPASDSGSGPSPRLRRMRLTALGAFAVLVLIFVARGLLS